MTKLRPTLPNTSHHVPQQSQQPIGEVNHTEPSTDPTDDAFENANGPQASTLIDPGPGNSPTVAPTGATRTVFEAYANRNTPWTAPPADPRRHSDNAFALDATLPTAVLQLLQNLADGQLEPEQMRELLSSGEMTAEHIRVVVATRPEMLFELPEQMQHSPELIADYIKHCPDNASLAKLSGLSEVFADDAELLQKLVKRNVFLTTGCEPPNPGTENYSSEQLQGCLDSVGLSQDILAQSQEHLLAVVELTPAALKLVPPEMLKDADLCIQILSKQHAAMAAFDPDLVATEEFGRLVLEKTPGLLGMLSSFSDLHWLADQPEVIQLARNHNFWQIIDPAMIDQDFVNQAIDRGAPLKGVPEHLLTRELVLKSFAFDPSHLLYGGEAWLGDAEVVLKAIDATKTSKSMELAYALWYSIDPALRQDTGFQRQAIWANGDFLAFADPRLQADREFVKDIVSRNGTALYYASEELRADPELGLLACASEQAALFASTCDDPEFFDQVVGQRPDNYLYVDQMLGQSKYGSDQAVLLNAVQNTRGNMLVGASPELLDRDFMLEAMAIDVHCIESAPKELLQDPEFLAAAARLFPPVLDALPEGALPASLILSLYPDVAKQYQQLNAELDSLDIDFPWRMGNLSTLRTVIDNRQALPNTSDKPLAVIIYPKEDWNGAFRSSQLDDLRQAYHVVYHEADDDADVVRMLKQSTAQNKADLLYIGGHGGGREVALGDSDPAYSPASTESALLDVSDEAQFKAAELDKCLSPDCPVILYSCSVAQGRTHGDNPTNMMARVLPGNTIYGQVVSIAGELVLDEDKKFQTMAYTYGEDIAYRARVDASGQLQELTDNIDLSKYPDLGNVVVTGLPLEQLQGQLQQLAWQIDSAMGNNNMVLEGSEVDLYEEYYSHDPNFPHQLVAELRQLLQQSLGEVSDRLSGLAADQSAELPVEQLRGYGKELAAWIDQNMGNQNWRLDLGELNAYASSFGNRYDFPAYLVMQLRTMLQNASQNGMGTDRRSSAIHIGRLSGYEQQLASWIDAYMGNRDFKLDSAEMASYRNLYSGRVTPFDQSVMDSLERTLNTLTQQSSSGIEIHRLQRHDRDLASWIDQSLGDQNWRLDQHELNRYVDNYRYHPQFPYYQVRKLQNLLTQVG